MTTQRYDVNMEKADFMSETVGSSGSVFVIVLNFDPRRP